MIYLISIIFILLTLVSKKDNKYVFVFGLIFMWVLFGWSYGNADYPIYLGRFYNYSNTISEITEPLFTNLMSIFNLLKFNYQEFLIIISAIILTIYGIFINKMTKNINFVLLLYFIFPFSMDVVQLRYTIATTIIIIGFYYLIKKDKKERNYKIFNLCSFSIMFPLCMYSFYNNDNS